MASPFGGGGYGQDGAANLSRFDHSLNRFRQPGDFSIAAHNIMGFLDLFFGRTGSNWVELGRPTMSAFLQIAATDCD